MSVKVHCTTALLAGIESHIFGSLDMYFCEFRAVETHVDVCIKLSLVTLVNRAWHAGE